MNKYKVPRWIEEGPMDLEYKTFKMLASVKALELKLAEGLEEAIADQLEQTFN